MVMGVDSNITTVSVSKNADTGSRVEAVAAVSPRPKLPDDGKNLPPGKTAEPVVDEKAIEEAVREFEQQAQLAQRELHFSIDKDSGRTVIKVMDASTQEVVRQIPSDEALRVARKLSEGEKLELFNSFT